jgi:AmiR/NasT family two-component response regulator
MIRQLRALTRELRMLKARLEAEEKVERQRPVLTSQRKRQTD